MGVLNVHVLTPSTLPPSVMSTANPPPPREEVHEVKVGESKLTVYPFGTLMYKAPPYPSFVAQRVNVMEGSVNEEVKAVNSNTPPFPLVRVMFSNVTAPLHDILPLPISISGLLFVPYFELPPLMAIEFNTTLPAPLTVTKLHPLDNVSFISIVNPVMFNVPAVTVNTLDEEEKLDGTVNVTVVPL